MKEKIILFGLTQTADIIEYYFNKYTDVEICARCVDKKYLTIDKYNNVPVVAFEDVEKYYPPSEYKISIPMMNTDLNRVREEKYKIAKAKGYKFKSYLSQVNAIETNNIGENVFIIGDCHIQPFSKIGNNCMIWSGTEIGHHTIIQDNCFITGAKVAGRITVENNCFIGHSSAIRDGITIGKYSIIGMASIVQKNIKPYTVLSVKQTKKWDITSEEAKEII